MIVSILGSRIKNKLKEGKISVYNGLSLPSMSHEGDKEEKDIDTGKKILQLILYTLSLYQYIQKSRQMLKMGGWVGMRACVRLCVGGGVGGGACVRACACACVCVCESVCPVVPVCVCVCAVSYTHLTLPTRRCV